MRVLLDEFSKSKIETTPYIKKLKFEDKLNAKWTCGFDSRASFQFYLIWSKCYTQNDNLSISKILPTKFSLTPNVLLHWYLGDGYFGSSIDLYSNNFSYQENIVLSKKLVKLGIVNKVREKNSTYYLSLSVKKSNREAFFAYLSEAKLHNKAQEIFPHKFDRTISKKELKYRFIERNPQFFIDNIELNSRNIF